jgi:hypothetical protein
MNLNWAIEHRNGQVTEKRDKQGNLNSYHTRQGHTKRGNAKTIALQDEAGNPKVIVEVPNGAEVFQRHRVCPINYNSQFHDVTTTILGHVENGLYIAETTQNKTYPEVTYQEVWIVGYRQRVGTVVTVYFKALYPDGKIDEHHGWTEKPWLFEPEWFPEENV